VFIFSVTPEPLMFRFSVTVHDILFLNYWESISRIMYVIILM